MFAARQCRIDEVRDGHRGIHPVAMRDQADRVDIGRRAARLVAGKDTIPEDRIVALTPTFLPGDTIRHA